MPEVEGGEFPQQQQPCNYCGSLERRCVNDDEWAACPQPELPRTITVEPNNTEMEVNRLRAENILLREENVRLRMALSHVAKTADYAAR